MHHQAPLPPQLDHIAVNVHLVLGLQTLQHGVDADVGAGAPHASAGNRNAAVSQVMVTAGPGVEQPTRVKRREEDRLPPAEPLPAGGGPGGGPGLAVGALTCSAPRWGR